jgi:hypothetical protein
LITGGDININYLIESKEKQELNNVLKSYNFVRIIYFPARITNNSSPAIDTIHLLTSVVIPSDLLKSACNIYYEDRLTTNKTLFIKQFSIPY